MCVLTRPVLTYITENPDSWEKDFKDKHIKVKYKGDLAIFNYEPGADFNDIIVRDARGLIIDMKNLRIVCYPFEKFGNSYESYVKEIDWETASVQEKIDGSITKLFYYQGKWHWATNSCIDAADASITGSSKSFYDVIISADNYKDINYDILDKNCTYIFELVSPLTQVVVYYPRTHLYHIGTRSNLSGLEFNRDIGIEKPKLYKLNSYDLESVISAAEAMNKDGVVEHEGFVVVDSNYNRMKVKNPEYLRLHHNVSIKVLTKKNALEILISNDEERIHAIEQNNYLAVQLSFYQWQLAELIWRINNYMTSARNIYKNLNNNRKLFAEVIKGEELQSFGFAAIDNPNLDAIGALHKYPLRCFLKFIDDYPEDK